MGDPVGAGIRLVVFKTWPSGVPLGMNRRYSTMGGSIHLIETSSVGWSRSISRPTPRHCRSGHQSADCGTGSSVPDGTELCKKVSSCNAADVASSRIRRELPGSSSVYASGWLTGEISGAQHYTLLCGVAVADASVAVMGGRDCRRSVTAVWSTASHTSLVWL